MIVNNDHSQETHATDVLTAIESSWDHGWSRACSAIVTTIWRPDFKPGFHSHISHVAREIFVRQKLGKKIEQQIFAADQWNCRTYLDVIDRR